MLSNTTFLREDLPLKCVYVVVVRQLLSVGGSSQDLAGLDTPASKAAYILDLGSEQWTPTSTPMTSPRVIGNAVLLPNRQVVLLNGAAIGRCPLHAP